MTNREKMAHHIAEAERWQAQALAMEDEALTKAQVKVATVKEYRGQQPRYIAKVDLKDNFWYARAVSNRDGNQAQAQMYGIAAMVDAISFPPVIVTE